jgi:PPOX class probable F420-dependent enzyme
MGVQLDQGEIDDFLTNSHTLILATLRKSGAPFMTPLWYVYLDGSLFVRTRSRSPKVQHIRRDPRVCCLVEEGEKWVDLKAVIINCNAEIIEDDPDLEARVSQAMGEKYSAFRTSSKAMPSATKKHYSTSSALIRMTPEPEGIRSWHNRKLRGLGQ